MIDAQFRFNQCNSFREEYISVFSQLTAVCSNVKMLKRMGEITEPCGRPILVWNQTPV
jgi:hypothetical protein